MSESEVSLWALDYHHRHGNKIYFALSRGIPEDEDFFKTIGETYEPDDGEHVNVYEVPALENGIQLPSLQGNFKLLE